MTLITSLPFTLFCVATLSAIIYLLINYFKTLSRLPPGPWGLPLLGCLPYFSKLNHLTFIELGKKYGGMFSIGLGTEQYVILNDWPTMKATILDRARLFSGRRQTILTNGICGGKDMLFTDGEIWKKQRNAVMNGMKIVGMSKKSVEGHLADMIEGLVEKLNNCIDKEMDLEPIIAKAFYNSNWKLLSNFDVSENQEDMKNFADDILNLITQLSGSNPLHYLPWLRLVPPNGFGYWKFQRCAKRTQENVRKLIRKHDIWIPPDESMLAYHAHVHEKKSLEGPPYQEDYLLGTILVLFAGALGTMSATTLLIIYYLCQHPEIQEKVQKELDTVVGRDRVPSMSDFKDLVQLEAVILETHRIGTVAPLSAPHKVLETVEINGYTIPKNTVCIQNIYAVHHDPLLWNEPEKFKPERFLNHENKIQTPPYLIPFSLGSRICPGQTFAGMELRMLFARILQQFKFSFPENQPQPPLVMVDGISTTPGPFPVVVKDRK